MTADAHFAQRAAVRLNTVLDEEGLPFDALGRSSALARLLESSPQIAQQLLSGLVPWSWDQLDKLCFVFDRPPGYFLDPAPSEALPSDTQVVGGADGGEAIVWRSPHGFLRTPPAPGALLRYLHLRGDHGPFAAGSLLLYSEQHPDQQDIRPGRIYVIEDGQGLQAMQCRLAHADKASFEPLGQQAVCLVIAAHHPAGGAPAQDTARVVGAVFAAVSSL